jgi:branched-chain amino acid transport system ATP-binding protein
VAFGDGRRGASAHRTPPNGLAQRSAPRTPVADLSHGQKRQLDIGMAIITDPEILLLDEPASGLSRGERERLSNSSPTWGQHVTLLLIEHDMDVALRVVDRVIVIADGQQIAEGTPEEIQHDPVVLETYLGTRGAE